MFRLFRRTQAETPRNLDQELAELERRATSAATGYETQFLIRAGDLCVDAAKRERALEYYGRAIDGYLESGRFSAAEAVCQKLLRLAPGAVRARCTLAWLCIGSGHLADAQREIASYVHAAADSLVGEYAAQQLRMMASATTALALREAIGEHLMDLGDHTGADEVFGEVFRIHNGLDVAPEQDAHVLWERMLRAALMGPEQMREQEEFEAAKIA